MEWKGMGRVKRKWGGFFYFFLEEFDWEIERDVWGWILFLFMNFLCVGSYKKVVKNEKKNFFVYCCRNVLDW